MHNNILFIGKYLKRITGHRRGWNNLSFSLFEKSIFLIIEVELPHQEGLKHTREFQYHLSSHIVVATNECQDYRLNMYEWNSINSIAYLFGNVFSIFSENSAPNKNLAGMRDVFIHQNKGQWADDVWTKPKQHIFTMMNWITEYGTENYVVYSLSKKQRSLWSQLRSGILL